MLCESVRPRLSALVDRELSPLEGWRLRRHLRHCDTCTNIFLDIESISQAADRLYQDAPLPYKFQARFVAKARKREGNTEIGRGPAHTRRTRKSIMLGPMVSAGVAACCAVGWVFYLRKTQSRVDFVDIAQTTQSFHTAHMLKTTVCGNPVIVVKEDVWANMDIPAIVFSEHLPGGKDWRVTYSHATIDRKPKGMQGRINQPISWDRDRNWAQSLRKKIAKLFIMPQSGSIAAQTSTRNTTRPFSAFDPSYGWHWTTAERVDLHGRSLLRLKGTKKNAKAVLFADPKTFRMVRFEQHWSDDYQRGVIIEYGGYDEPVSPGIFVDVRP